MDVTCERNGQGLAKITNIEPLSRCRLQVSNSNAVVNSTCTKGLWGQTQSIGCVLGIFVYDIPPAWRVCLTLVAGGLTGTSGGVVASPGAGAAGAFRWEIEGREAMSKIVIGLDMILNKSVVNNSVVNAKEQRWADKLSMEGPQENTDCSKWNPDPPTSPPHLPSLSLSIHVGIIFWYCKWPSISSTDFASGDS